MKSKTTAAILAFFLGGFGGHRFYLGQVGKGFLYLLFFWTGIPFFIAFIDFIIFLTMDDKRFDVKYNQEYMGTLYGQPTVVVNNHIGQGQVQPQYSTAAQRQEEQRRREAQRRHEEQRRLEAEWQNGERRRQEQNVRPAARKTRPAIDPFQKSGDEKYQEYDFDGAIKDYRRSLNVKSSNPTVHFRLACLYSIMEQTDESFFHLEKAVEHGFYDFDKIQSHDHLAFLRSQQPTFDMFVANNYRVGGTVEEPEDVLELSDEKVTQLERLAKMRDAGLLTDDEFRAQKVKLLR